MKTEIIAELGINHNGDLSLCKKMIDILCDCGVDAVKFQIVSKELNYNLPKKSPLLPFFSQSDLGLKGYIEMSKYTRKKGIRAYSSIADIYALKTFKEADFEAIKLSSSNLTNRPLHEKVVELNKPIIFSTGSGTLEEIINTANFFQSKKVDYSILHCIAQYPAMFDQLNLRVIPYLKKILNIEVGFSDHTEGALAGIMAIQHGAKILEKHFTLDHNMEGPDHVFSLNPEEMKQYVSNVRLAESVLGSPKKYFSESIASNKGIKRAIVLTRDYKEGETIEKNDLVIARPNVVETNYIHPFDYSKILNKKVSKQIPSWNAITWDNI